jgi:hypothetical protein
VKHVPILTAEMDVDNEELSGYSSAEEPVVAKSAKKKAQNFVRRQKSVQVKKEPYSDSETFDDGDYRSAPCLTTQMTSQTLRSVTIWRVWNLSGKKKSESDKNVSHFLKAKRQKK